MGELVSMVSEESEPSYLLLFLMLFVYEFVIGMGGGGGGGGRGVDMLEILYASINIPILLPHRDKDTT